MWPFKPKQPKTPYRDIHAERVEQLARLFPLGQETQYLGTTMEPIGHFGYAPAYPHGVTYYGRLELRYMDELGVVREVSLTYPQAIALARRLGMDTEAL